MIKVVCWLCCVFMLLYKQRTEYEMRIRDWRSDGCSSDLWFRCSSKKARGESAPAAVAANQAVAIEFDAAPLAQVARLENERGNGRADTRHRGRGIAKRQPAGDRKSTRLNSSH